MNQPVSDSPMQGTIMAAFGRHYEVKLDHPAEGQQAVIKCDPRGKKSIYACGDHVDIQLSSLNQGVINSLQTRQNLLWRSDAFRQKLIASNLSQIVIVVATEPGFSDLLISRCIAAAEHQHINTLIVLNKVELQDRLGAARKLLKPFSELGYRIVEMSALDGAAPLLPFLNGERSIFVGQSGMGKSTLTNALIPEAQAATREISEALDSGKHTTTFARLYPFESGGWLIDSPGMQAFGLAHMDTDEIAESFIELRPHLGKCRFRDCKHDAEPGCALTAAIEAGTINRRRMDHYRLIRAEITQARKQVRGW